MNIRIYYYYTNIFPGLRAQHYNYATLLAGSNFEHKVFQVGMLHFVC